MFPASRGLFSVVFAEVMGAWKRELCLGSKHTVFSTHHGYLATKPSRDTCTFSTRSNDAGSLNDSRITVNECAGDSEPKSWSANNTGKHAFCKRCQFNEYEGKEASPSRETELKLDKLIYYALVSACRHAVKAA